MPILRNISAMESQEKVQHRHLLETLGKRRIQDEKGDVEVVCPQLIGLQLSGVDINQHVILALENMSKARAKGGAPLHSLALFGPHPDKRGLNFDTLQSLVPDLMHPWRSPDLSYRSPTPTPTPLLTEISDVMEIEITKA
jgi:hypothetical protein